MNLISKALVALMAAAPTLALAADAPVPQGPGAMGQIVMLGGFVAIFYFLLWRPQSKRAKEHKELVGGLAKGDEALTNGGLLGKVTKVSEEFVVLKVAENVELNVQRQAIAAVVPKGTIKAI